MCQTGGGVSPLCSHATDAQRPAAQSSLGGVRAITAIITPHHTTVTTPYRQSPHHTDSHHTMASDSGIDSQSSPELEDAPMSRTHQYRHHIKPLLERKRRARINKCVDELKVE